MGAEAGVLGRCRGWRERVAKSEGTDLYGLARIAANRCEALGANGISPRSRADATHLTPQRARKSLRDLASCWSRTGSRCGQLPGRGEKFNWCGATLRQRTFHYRPRIQQRVHPGAALSGARWRPTACGSGGAFLRTHARNAAAAGTPLGPLPSCAPRRRQRNVHYQDRSCRYGVVLEPHL
jgi:hypothetical protein